MFGKENCSKLNGQSWKEITLGRSIRIIFLRILLLIAALCDLAWPCVTYYGLLWSFNDKILILLDLYRGHRFKFIWSFFLLFFWVYLVLNKFENIYIDWVQVETNKVADRSQHIFSPLEDNLDVHEFYTALKFLWTGISKRF